jgi:DNA-binding MarR family transcriptional regulator
MLQLDRASDCAGECMSVQETSGEESVELSAADASEIARLLQLLLEKAPPQLEERVILQLSPAASSKDRARRSTLIAKAHALFSERKRRSQHFNSVIFGEPAWDMLLALYITEDSGTRLSIGKLVGLIGEPQTTALRWINYLEKERLIARQVDLRDRRAVTIEMTDKARQKLDEYFATLPVALPPQGR